MRCKLAWLSTCTAVAALIVPVAVSAPSAAAGVTWNGPIAPGGVTAGAIASTTLGPPTISCWSPGSCEAVGTYDDTTGANVLYVDNENQGVWGVARTLGRAPYAAAQPAVMSVSQLSCVGEGSCTLVGTYVAASTSNPTVFVGTENAGSWGSLDALPGLATLDTGGEEQADALACASAGSCTVAGTYLDATGATGIFVSSLTEGVWSDAATLPAASDAGSPSFATVSALSCPTATACTIVGSYADSSGKFQVLLDNESDGAWTTPTQLTTIAGINAYFAQGTAAWCGAPASCEIGGIYTDGSGNTQGFVAAESDGSVTAAEPIPELASLNAGGVAAVDAVGCTAPGECVIGGSYLQESGDQAAFVELVSSGTPQAAAQLPGWTTLDHIDGGSSGGVDDVACGTSACAVAGSYTDSSGVTQVFGDSESAGTWDTVGAVAGAPSSDTSGNSSVLTLACSASLACDLVASGSTSTGGTATYEVGNDGTTWAWSQLFAPSSAVELSADAGGDGVFCWFRGDCAAVGWYEASTSSELPWIDFEIAGVWGSASAIPLSTADLYVVPESVTCVNQYNCVVVVQVAPTVSLEGSPTTPEVLIEHDRVWSGPSALSVVNASYTVTPYDATATCAMGACHVVAMAWLYKGSSNVGSETAVANVVDGGLSAFVPLDVVAAPKQPDFRLSDTILTCGSASQCIEVDDYFRYSSDSEDEFSDVHVDDGTGWTTVAHLVGVPRATDTTGVTNSTFTIDAASCATGASCVLVGSASEKAGPEERAVALSLSGTHLSAPYAVHGYPTSSAASNAADEVACFGENCVVVGFTFTFTSQGPTEKIVVSALHGSSTALLATSEVSLQGEGIAGIACSGPRSCMFLTVDFSQSGEGELLYYETYDGRQISSSQLLPGASEAEDLDGLATAPGGTYAALFDAGTVVTQPFIADT